MIIKENNKNNGLMTVRFPIGVKLIVLISIIVILSLGSITALVSWLFRADLQVSAEESNFESNRAAAMEAEMTFENVRAHSRILIKTTTAEVKANVSELTDFFFRENPQIAAVLYTSSGNQNKIFINRHFFASREIDAQSADNYFENLKTAFGRAAQGETLLLNAAPHFKIPLIALIYPWQEEESEAKTAAKSAIQAGAVLFSSESLNQNFGYGTNQSYMINSSGDLLSHTEFSLVRSGVNVYEENFIKDILQSNEKSKQHLVESDFKYLHSADSITDTGNPSVMRQFIAFTKLETYGGAVITGIEYDKVFEGIQATTRRNLYLTAAVLSISIILIWFFSKTISVPLKTLAAAAHEIEGGNFDTELKPEGMDEIGVLTNSFLNMCGALHIFGRFTNREIAVKAMRGEIKPGGLTKHATIFFSDIRGFTAKSEKFAKTFGDKSSDLIVQWLNNYFTQMIDCIEKTNGVIDKFIGDAVMAHWGTAYSTGSPVKDAFNCVKAALMMRNVLYAMNKERAGSDDTSIAACANPPIQIGCGINSGIVTAGQLGSEKRMEYTVIGDPVNLASRIESLTKPLGTDILISEDTWKLVGSCFITEEMPSVTVKGKAQPVRLFAVINTAGSSKAPQTLADVRKILGIKPVDIQNFNINADEKKYKIAGNKS